LFFIALALAKVACVKQGTINNTELPGEATLNTYRVKPFGIRGCVPDPNSTPPDHLAHVEGLAAVRAEVCFASIEEKSWLCDPGIRHSVKTNNGRKLLPW